MASRASFPIHMNGSDLQFGNVTIPLETATCFWTGDKLKHRVHVYLHTGEFQTTLRLFLESAENVRACIEIFRQIPKMKPCLFYVSSVMPILQDQMAGRVDFKFMDAADMDFFTEYARPIFGYDWEVEKRADRVSLTFNTPDTRENQIVKINQLLKRIKYRFVASGIDEALKALRNPDFPPSPIQTYPRPLLLHHIREYSITKDGAIEELDMIADTPVKIPVDFREVEEWILNPISQVGKEPEKVERLKLRIQRLLQIKPINRPEISALLRAAFSIRSFNIRSLFERDTVRSNG